MNDTPWVKSYPAPARWDAPLALGLVYAILDKARIVSRIVRSVFLRHDDSAAYIVHIRRSRA
jgi:hypothetical protein